MCSDIEEHIGRAVTIETFGGLDIGPAGNQSKNPALEEDNEGDVDQVGKPDESPPVECSKIAWWHTTALNHEYEVHHNHEGSRGQSTVVHEPGAPFLFQEPAHDETYRVCAEEADAHDVVEPPTECQEVSKAYDVKDQNDSVDCGADSDN